MTPISRGELVRTDAVMFVITTLFVFSRAALQFSKRKALELPDLLIYVSYVFYVALWACFHAVLPMMYRIYAVARGEMEIYPTIMQDAATGLKLISAGQVSFFTVLVTTKLSLLAFYHKLLVGVAGIYRLIWWGTVLFVVAGWITSILLTIFTCNHLDAKYRDGYCSGTPDEDRRIVVSLWVGYAFDITADLAIMFLPICLTWKLQMPRGQKAGVFVLFGSGWICITFATLRAIQLETDGHGNTATLEYVPIWTVLECTIAILIACAPAFAILIRKRLNSSKKTSHNAQGYIQPGNEDIRMKSLVSSGSRPKRSRSDMFWEDAHSSQEELAKNAGRIVVKTTLHQNNDEMMSRSSKGV